MCYNSIQVKLTDVNLNEALINTQLKVTLKTKNQLTGIQLGFVNEINLEKGFGFVLVQGHDHPFRITTPENRLGENGRLLKESGPRQALAGKTQPFFTGKTEGKLPLRGDNVMVLIAGFEITHWCHQDDWKEAEAEVVFRQKRALQAEEEAVRDERKKNSQLQKFLERYKNVKGNHTLFSSAARAT